MTQIDEILSIAALYIENLPPAPTAFIRPEGSAIAGWIDHTLLKPTATSEDILLLCKEAKEYRFASVCINPAYVDIAVEALADTDVPVCTVIGFPLGASDTNAKVAETIIAQEAGAKEFDMVLNVGWLKGNECENVYTDVRAVVNTAHDKGGIVKVILENCTLTKEEIITASLICQAAGADFVKTSTGFSTGGATLEDVALMRRVVGLDMGVKAAGGIKSLSDAYSMIDAGANRLGASAGISIVQQATTYSPSS